VKVILPKTLAGLWEALGDHPEAMVFAGGTDLIVKIRAQIADPPVIVGLEKIPELQGISDEEDAIVIGSCTTHREILIHQAVKKFLPILQQAVHVLGSPPIRNMATIGGNICTASPAGDTLPSLYVYDAEIELISSADRRRMKIADFIIGSGKTAIGKGEILASVRIPKHHGFAIHHFEKVGQRKAMSISIASLAAMVNTDTSGSIESIACAWGSVAPTVVRSANIEDALKGLRFSREDLQVLFPLIFEAVAPISDVRASAEYRRHLAANLLLRLTTFKNHR
jgi:CO/xanthine dehydrogenase FAD-binding subunit